MGVHILPFYFSQFYVNYMGAPIQIRVYDDKISIWNEDPLPEGLTLDALKRSHSSKPRNPIIADVSFKGGYIDALAEEQLKSLIPAGRQNCLSPTCRSRMADLLSRFLIIN